jgi:hypothetical protein
MQVCVEHHNEQDLLDKILEIVHIFEYSKEEFIPGDGSAVSVYYALQV